MQMSSQRRQGGFTLVEMAVVLVIIGVIIGAVMIGRDVQRNAEYTRIKQKFVDQWVVTYNSYHQRYGAPIGDNQSAPQLMVNGAHFTGFSGGDMSGENALSLICSGTDGLHDDVEASRETATGFDLRDLVRKAGITLPPGRGEGKEDRYAYLDTNGNPQEIRVCFGWNPPGTAYGSGNSMVITGLTPDLARSLDQMIDGKADAGNGAFRQYITGLTRQATAAGGATNATAIGTEWGGNNTGSMASTTDGKTFGTATDDDQIMTVVANYKMNQ
ncbi:MAG: prepilin-type N-terminal cleavage/methylation domain-containing protein [Stenotrophomonas sp.]|uniref:prepilin-type N-terminal cleavage/methylation domain-containing protein n=1 Tax=Stenotrophomonas sp. TaxID=69392 RepID=UPI001354ECA1|nr:prepilin-type N-terminal cleavage/methylation domain-containing protein [Stenotrophomonas sp.]MTI75348.1 prepilin-type N-terminal cleavage/methylation domain-containing protein [Stenotrophomonas sp.]